MGVLKERPGSRVPLPHTLRSWPHLCQAMSGPHSPGCDAVFPIESKIIDKFTDSLIVLHISKFLYGDYCKWKDIALYWLKLDLRQYQGRYSLR